MTTNDLTPEPEFVLSSCVGLGCPANCTIDHSKPLADWELALMAPVEDAPRSQVWAESDLDAMEAEGHFIPSEAELLSMGELQANETREALAASQASRELEADLDELPARTRLVIRHYFPNGGTVGDGFIHAGDQRPQPRATFNPAEAKAALASFREHSPRDTFEVALAD